MKTNNNKLKNTKYTIQEIWMAMRGNVQKSKKTYSKYVFHWIISM